MSVWPSLHFLQGQAAVTSGWDDDRCLCWGLVQRCSSGRRAGQWCELLLPAHPLPLLSLLEFVWLCFCCLIPWNSGGNGYWGTFKSSLVGLLEASSSCWQVSAGVKVNKKKKKAEYLIVAKGMLNSTHLKTKNNTVARLHLRNADSTVRAWVGTSCGSWMWS